MLFRSAYLQEHVFDSLTERGYFDLSALDWDAVQLCQLVTADYADRYKHMDRSWLQRINVFLRQTDAASQTGRCFF